MKEFIVETRIKNNRLTKNKFDSKEKAIDYILRITMGVESEILKQLNLKNCFRKGDWSIHLFKINGEQKILFQLIEEKADEHFLSSIKDGIFYLSNWFKKMWSELDKIQNSKKDFGKNFTLLLLWACYCENQGLKFNCKRMKKVKIEWCADMP